MAGLSSVLMSLCWILGAINLVCFVLVLVKMCCHEDIGLAGLSLLLTFCSGFGVLIGFFAGWVYVGKYDAFRLMGFWTAICFAQLMFGMAYGLIQMQAEGLIH